MSPTSPFKTGNDTVVVLRVALTPKETPNNSDSVGDDGALSSSRFRPALNSQVITKSKVLSPGNASTPSITYPMDVTPKGITPLKQNNMGDDQYSPSYLLSGEGKEMMGDLWKNKWEEVHNQNIRESVSSCRTSRGRVEAAKEVEREVDEGAVNPSCYKFCGEGEVTRGEEKRADEGRLREGELDHHNDLVYQDESIEWKSLSYHAML